MPILRATFLKGIFNRFDRGNGQKLTVQALNVQKKKYQKYILFVHRESQGVFFSCFITKLLMLLQSW